MEQKPNDSQEEALIRQNQKQWLLDSQAWLQPINDIQLLKKKSSHQMPQPENCSCGIEGEIYVYCMCRAPLNSMPNIDSNDHRIPLDFQRINQSIENPINNATLQKMLQQNCQFLTTDIKPSSNMVPIQDFLWSQMEETESQNKSQNEKKINNFLFDSIFQRKIVCTKSNKNVPRTLTNNYLKNFKRIVKKQKCQNQLSRHFSKIQRQIKKRTEKTNAYNISDIQNLMGVHSDLRRKLKKINRKLFSQSIEETIEEIATFDNNKCESKLSYMVAMKIYRHRCRSQLLMERVKMV